MNRGECNVANTSARTSDGSARTDEVVSAVSFIPFVGSIIACPIGCLAPAAYGVAATAVGNKFSAQEAPILWPVVTSYAGAAITGIVGVSTFVVLTLVVVGGFGALFTTFPDPTVLAGLTATFFIPIVSLVAISVIGFFGTTAAVAHVWSANATDKADPESFSLALFDVKEPFFGGPEAHKPGDVKTPAKPTTAKPAEPAAAY